MQRGHVVGFAAVESVVVFATGALLVRPAAHAAGSFDSFFVLFHVFCFSVVMVSVFAASLMCVSVKPSSDV
jgi:hypothetical protein